jgi:predicted ATPase
VEFAEQWRAKEIPFFEAHCPAHGKAVPFLPLLELLRNLFGICDRDSEREARRKIVGELLLLDEAFQDMLAIVLDFLGVADPERLPPEINPEARQRLLFGFVRHLVQARSARQSVVLLLDDVHWIDPGSDAFLAQIVEAVHSSHTLVLVNFRPEYHAKWMQKSYYQQLPLMPLGSEAIQELLRHLLGEDPSLSGLHDLIERRTRGNPFFIEEMVQSLVEVGSLAGQRGAYQLHGRVEELEIPATVQSILAARIDRLADHDKHVLQTASVIGKQFSEPILRRVMRLPDLAASLNALQRAEFIYEEALYPEAEYAFKHPLTQEVAYRSQLQERRREVH